MFDISNPAVRHSLVAIVVIAIAFIISTLLRKVLNLFINKSSAKLNVDPTKYSFLKNGLSFIIYTVALFFIIYTVPALRNLGTTLFASAGLFAAFLGLASQQAFSNIVGGIFIVIFKPFRVGDVVSILNTYDGTIEDITLRHTVIRDFQNKRIVIPNSVINSETIINSNLNDDRINRQLFFGISYESNVELAKKIIKEEAEKHPFCIDWRTKEDIKNGEEKVKVRLFDFGDSAIVLRANVWSENPTFSFELKCELNEIVKKRFDMEGIEIPFPHRTLVFKNQPNTVSLKVDTNEIA